MNSYLRRLAGILLAIPTVLLSGGAFAEGDAEIVRWDRAPISLSLPIGKERYIWFPGKVQPGLPPELVESLRVQAVNDTIYLKALEAFETTRLPVRDLTNGDFYLLDIKTSADAPATPLQLVKVDGRDEQALVQSGDAKGAEAQGIGYVTLTRFAAQQIYAPKRLAKQEAGIHAVPLPANQAPIPGLYSNAQVQAVPVASWRGSSGLYVTAVKVTNVASTPLPLDPRLAQGQWLTATFHHQSLGPKGEPSDQSTLYLISDRPFLEVVEQWLG